MLGWRLLVAAARGWPVADLTHSLERSHPLSTLHCTSALTPRHHAYHTAAGVLGLAAAGAASGAFDMGSGGAGAGASAAAPAAERAPPPLPRENAVLVLGGTGKLGRRIVEKVSGAVHGCRADW